MSCRVISAIANLSSVAESCTGSRTVVHDDAQESGAVKKLFRVENSSLIMYFRPISHTNDVITRQWSDKISINCF